LVVDQTQVVELLVIGDECVEELADLEQLAPVFVRTRQTRHFATEDDADVTDRHLRE
jgi:hypothetical protein